MNMKCPFLFLILFVLTGTGKVAAQGGSTPPAAKEWFDKKEWLQGLSITPHAAVDVGQFARQYHLNPQRWDSVFLYLKNTDLAKLPNGRHVISGETIYAIVTEAPTRDYEKTLFESHLRFIDLQYAITGEEAMAKTPVTAITVNRPYNENADIAFYTGEGTIHTVPAGTFMLFFPSEAHRPNITPGGNKVVKKIVVKVRLSE
jgi:biofilm protein TabA